MPAGEAAVTRRAPAGTGAEPGAVTAAGKAVHVTAAGKSVHAAIASKPVHAAIASKPVHVTIVSKPVHVTIVTMDSHMSTAFLAAAERVAFEVPGLTLAIHTADHWDDPAALAECLSDIGRADIVVAGMLFLDEHIKRVLPALAARREACDAMLCCVSAGEVVRLTKLGKFSMAAGQGGPMALLKKLRGSKKPGSSGAGQMKMLKNLPKMLRFIPGTAQDMRSYFLAMQYWLAGSEENFANMIRMLVGKYAAGAAGAALKAAPPVGYPEIGLYHPAARGRMVESLDLLPRRAGEIATVGVLVLRSYVLAGNAGHYDGVIAALEKQGLRVLPAFASGLDAREAITRFFMKDGVATVDAVVSLTGFSLVGGPAYNDSRAAEELLARLDVPYVAAHPVEFQTLAQWENDARGLTPVEATMMVALPELDGATGPITFGGRGGPKGHDMFVHPERAAMLAARVARLATLKRRARAQKKLAIVIFNFPPNAGATGTAAYLAVFESLFNTLRALAAGGYRVDVPESVEALRRAILEGNATRFGADANVAWRIPANDHVKREPHLRELEQVWGPAPGRAQSDGSGIFVLGRQFGHVFVGVQPNFGYEGDPMRLLFEGSFAPTHAFCAFYRWIREDFAADAVLHFGTHGALEFMPGKQTGMSAKCWPDRLIGDVPNFYFYASNNPSEGLLAKRRGAATLISHLTPSVTQAGLYRGLAELKSGIDRFRQLEPGAAEAGDLAAMIQAQAAALDMARAEPLWGPDAGAQILALSTALRDVEYSLIPHGLHVIGAPPSAGERAQILDAAGIADAQQRAALDALMAAEPELPALLHALDGGYTHPAPGGDLLRNQDVLPTGRNIHGFDPFRLPSLFAVKDGAAQADRLLARHLADTGALPQTVAMVLWGSDNLKNEGGPVAQALWLMGAEPRMDGYGRLCGAQLVPLERLGRPRIDVLITLSGIFRDLLPLQTRLLAEAAFLAASAAEPRTQNYLRAHALDHVAAHGGDIAQAALRVFSNGDGAYGANVNVMLDSGTWAEEDELAEAFVRRKGFAYGADGRAARQDAVFGGILKTVEATYQNLESVELGVTSIDHYFDSLGGIAGAVRRARGGDAARVYVGDQTQGGGAVRSLAEQVSLETRTRALNPKWYEALLGHGYEGVRQIEATVTNTLGWSATTGEVAPWVYQKLTETYVLDPEMRARLAALNPKASARIANRLIEAHERKYWQPDPAVLQTLLLAGEELEDKLEGIGLEAVAA
jgi:magnesium chelatase subunit H